MTSFRSLFVSCGMELSTGFVFCRLVISAIDDPEDSSDSELSSSVLESVGGVLVLANSLLKGFLSGAMPDVDGSSEVSIGLCLTNEGLQESAGSDVSWEAAGSGSKIVFSV